MQPPAAVCPETPACRGETESQHFAIAALPVELGKLPATPARARAQPSRSSTASGNRCCGRRWSGPGERGNAGCSWFPSEKATPIEAITDAGNTDLEEPARDNCGRGYLIGSGWSKNGFVGRRCFFPTALA